MSPFRSEKQRRYLWMNEPKLAKKWTKKYGSKIDGGGKEKSPAKFKRRNGTA